jgi:polyphosphate kinase 2 (PPK2 family)
VGEQRKKIAETVRRENHWKFSAGDLKERERWDDYMRYYEQAINKTSTEIAPWWCSAC